MTGNSKNLVYISARVVLVMGIILYCCLLFEPQGLPESRALAANSSAHISNYHLSTLICVGSLVYVWLLCVFIHPVLDFPKHLEAHSFEFIWLQKLP
jgi:hypothetical protein